jgi:hypothetical protein
VNLELGFVLLVHFGQEKPADGGTTDHDLRRGFAATQTVVVVNTFVRHGSNHPSHIIYLPSGLKGLSDGIRDLQVDQVGRGCLSVCKILNKSHNSIAVKMIVGDVELI